MLRKTAEAWIEYCGEGHEQYIFYCPGCKHDHTYVVKWGANVRGQQGRTVEWAFNGDLEHPTFTPSLLYTPEDHGTTYRCHLYLTNGMLCYLADCTHELAGCTVPMAPC